MLAEARRELRTYLAAQPNHHFFIGQADDPVDELEAAIDDAAEQADLENARETIA